MAYPADSVSIPAQTIGDSLVFFIGPACLVSSSSRSGDFHSVIDGKCSCQGFSYRGRCKHLAIAYEAMEADRATATPACECGRGPWTVRLDGRLYCGVCAPSMAVAE